jgi:hypothetical protein
MITIVMGTAAPNAPPIIIANADSSLATVCSSYPDMPLLHRAPAPRVKWTGMVNKGLTAPKGARRPASGAAGSNPHWRVRVPRRCRAYFR